MADLSAFHKTLARVKVRPHTIGCVAARMALAAQLRAHRA